jgi:hypothetical protein
MKVLKFPLQFLMAQQGIYAYSVLMLRAWWEKVLWIGSHECIVHKKVITKGEYDGTGT